jgi:ABC-2 type transport system permease protein
VIPILLVGNAPVRFLFNAEDYWLLVWLAIMLLIIWVIAARLWDMGLRAYESASS